MASKKAFYTKHARGLTLFMDGSTRSVDSSHPSYEEILKHLRANRFSKAFALMSVKAVIMEAAAAAAKEGKIRIQIVNGSLEYIARDGTAHPITGPFAARVMEAVGKGMTEKAIRPLLLFMDNMMKNKNESIRQELYEFMESGKMPITNDGQFLAYKKVGSNFKDIYTGTMDNSPGKLVWMNPKEVDTNRNNTCSVGLHFCSRGYLPSYGTGGGNKIVIVKVNPRFVFAIPNDYQNTKGRASEYLVVGECTGNPEKDEAFLQPFIFDESLKKGAPSVKFVGSLKASLKQLAEGYKLFADKACTKVWVRVEDSKGGLAIEKYSVVRKVGTGKSRSFVSAITGKEVNAEHVRLMAFETKSVRSAMVRAVARTRH